MPDPKDSIEFTPYKLKAFKVAYNLALNKHLEMFTFENHSFLVGYAKYLIEYLDSVFKD